MLFCDCVCSISGENHAPFSQCTNNPCPHVIPNHFHTTSFVIYCVIYSGGGRDSTVKGKKRIHILHTLHNKNNWYMYVGLPRCIIKVKSVVWDGTALYANLTRPAYSSRETKYCTATELDGIWYFFMQNCWLAGRLFMVKACFKPAVCKTVRWLQSVQSGTKEKWRGRRTCRLQR